jgi:hypothetical protein
MLGAEAGRTNPLDFFVLADLDATTDFIGAATDFAEDLFAEDLVETADGLEETLPFGFEDDLATRNPSRFR